MFNNVLKVLLTTPDYPPKLGGLSTFTINLELTLKSLGINVELLVWDSIQDLRKKSNQLINNNSAGFTYIINIHFMGGYFFRHLKSRHINFYHGSEILNYSPNLVKRLMKKLLKNKFNKYISSTYLNCFISNFTKEKLYSQGVIPNYGRDIVIHNCIDTNDSEFILSNFDDKELNLVCVARDVAHKNIDGVINLAEKIAVLTNKKINLYLTTVRIESHPKINIVKIDKISSADRNKIYQRAHFNLLLSKDHSSVGFYEGFGLTVLEAASFGTPSIVLNTGGLSESVHHQQTGWVLTDKFSSEDLFSNLNKKDYETISKKCFSHVKESHSLDLYKKLLKKVMKNEK